MTLGALRFNGNISDERLSRHAWYYPGSNDHAHEVCTKEPVFGLCDILGNVWEWTSTQGGSFRAFRGGGWFNFANLVRSGDRDSLLPEIRYDGLGFRLVRISK